ncbi:MAG: YraN family protein [Flavobacteriaceae bacterium]
MGEHNEFGKHGEDIAVAYLIEKGYEVVYRNFRYLKGEIDIIAQKNDVLAMVEVRSRSDDRIIKIADTVGRKKIALLVMTADRFVTERNLDVEVRFDIIAILKNTKIFKIEHLEGAFYHF